MRRLFLEELKDHLPKKEFTILTGARQTGKSTLMHQLQDFCKANNTPVIYLNLEQKAILADLDEDPLNLLRYLPESTERIVVLVDEVQYLKDSSNFLKLL